MGKKDDIRDVLVPAIEKRRALDSLWHLEPAALARRVIKSKYIKALVHDLLNSDIKQLESLCIKKFPAPAATNGGSETAPAASQTKLDAAAYVPFHPHTSHFPRTDARYTCCATSEAAPSATFRAAQCAACRASHDTTPRHTSHR